MQSVSHIANMKLFHLTLYVHFDLTAHVCITSGLIVHLFVVHLFISECIIVRSLYCFCLKECHCPDYSKRVYSKAYSVSSEPGNTPQKGPWAANASNAGFWFFTSSRAAHTEKRHVSSLNLALSPISFASLVFKPAAG